MVRPVVLGSTWFPDLTGNLGHKLIGQNPGQPEVLNT